jgi:hypothetical protein
MNNSQIKPYRVRCRSDAKGEYFFYFGDRGQYYRRLRRRQKKALKTLTLTQMIMVIARIMDEHEQFLERTPQLTGWPGVIRCLDDD